MFSKMEEKLYQNSKPEDSTFYIIDTEVQNIKNQTKF